METRNNKFLSFLLIAAAWLIAIALVVLVYLKAKAFLH